MRITSPFILSGHQINNAQLYRYKGAEAPTLIQIVRMDREIVWIRAITCDGKPEIHLLLPSEAPDPDEVERVRAIGSWEKESAVMCGRHSESDL